MFFKVSKPFRCLNSNRKHAQVIGLLLFSLLLFGMIHVFSKGETSCLFLVQSKFDQLKSRLQTNSVRICCLILTNHNGLFNRTRAVHETWGPRCDRHLFIIEDFKHDNLTSEQTHFIQQLPILSAGNISHGREHLTEKVNTALLFAHQHYLNDFDWFVKADDDTYIILDNLRAFLAKQNATEPVTFGCNFKVNHSKKRKSIEQNVLGDGERWLSFGWCIVCVESRIIETISSRSSDSQ